MSAPLTGRVAIVTGAARGLGKAIARALADDGAAVAVADIDAPAAEATAEELRLKGAQAVAYEHDVRSERSSQELAGTVLSDLGRVDVLVNNAGVGPNPAPFQNLTELEWDRVMDINAKGVFLTTKAVAPTMIAQRSGRIIHISSVVAKRASPNILPYAASKWAVVGMTQTMARELAQFDVTVNAVCPGVIRTELHEGVVSRMSAMTGKDQDDVWQTFYDRIALGRLQEPEDIAAMVTFLASDKGRNITGSAFNVNGGMEFN
ncbi:SDR family NAD(P)-dependent oxidoreductase [Dactylosporangium sp. CA-092794]|uniref:SDR family NAD(P)-dependent oxidoreductase n=1 Tax=Dactylosporangium sp. CA-092794 TaxID=3239929 RepID=UPI003D8E4E52